jgi:hypothetical protein
MPFFFAISATSVSKLSHFSQQTNPSHSAYEFESSSQRSHIFKPAQSNLQASAVGCIGSMKRMNLRNEEHGFISVSGSACPEAAEITSRRSF